MDEVPRSTDVARVVFVPAILLFVLAVIWSLLLVTAIGFNIFLLVSGAAAAMPQPTAMTKETQVTVRLVVEVLSLGMQAAIIAAAYHMRELRNYSLARFGAAFACVPCCSPLLLLGIPVGAWALWVLGRSDVQEAFED